MMNIKSKMIIGLMATSMVWACTPPEKKEMSEAEPDPWDQLDSIKSLIKETSFKDAKYSIIDFGAMPDDDVSDADAIQTAINTCSEEGGGMVVVPAGVFLSKSIYLKSNVNFHLEEGAEVRFSTNPEDYLPLVHTRWEGTELMGLRPLIYSFEEENIAVTGKGVLHGQSDMENWWPWCGAKKYGWIEGTPNQSDDDHKHELRRMADKDVPVEERVFGIEARLRPQFFQPYRCERVLVKDVTFKDSPMWIMNPVLCTNVIVDGVSVISHGPNSDGCDPEASKNVWIKNCYFDTGDDCIAIKSGRDRDGRRVGVSSENIIIQNCEMKDGHGGVVIGSEISGGARNVFAEDCFMDSPNLDRALRLKTSSKRGGTIENVYMRNVEVGQVREAVVRFNMFYEDPGDFMPTIRNVKVENVNVKNGGKYGILAKAYEESPVQNVTLINVKIDTVKTELQLENVKNLVLKDVYMNGKLISSPNESGTSE